MSRDGFLEEVLFHAGAHSLDEQHADSAGWRAAQEADGAFISAHARDNSDRGDLAESLLAYFAARVLPGRISEADRAAIEATIPHRLEGMKAHSDGAADSLIFPGVGGRPLNANTLISALDPRDFPMLARVYQPQDQPVASKGLTAAKIPEWHYKRAPNR